MQRIVSKNACKRYQDLSEERKNMEKQHGPERYSNLPEDKKQRLVVYRKKYDKL